MRTANFTIGIIVLNIIDGFAQTGGNRILIVERGKIIPFDIKDGIGIDEFGIQRWLPAVTIGTVGRTIVMVGIYTHT